MRTVLHPGKEIAPGGCLPAVKEQSDCAGTEAALPVVSVVVPSYRRPKGVEAAVRSVLANDYPPDRLEIIVVESGGDETTRRLMRDFEREHPGRVWFFEKKPEGPGASRNFGAARARGALIAFLDSDCEAAPGWLRHVIQPFLDRPEVGIVQGKTMPPPGEQLGIRSRYVTVDGSDWIFHTCNILYRREAFDAVGGFSSGFYYDFEAAAASRNKRPGVVWIMSTSGEDADLGWRVLERGWETAFSREGIVYHEVRRLGAWRWFIDEACYSFGLPRLVRAHPKIREHLYWGYFSEKAHAFLLLMLAAAPLLLVHWSAVLLCVPYVCCRASESSRFWKGVLRPFRALVYLPRDLMTVIILLFSSIKSRTLAI